MNMQGAPIFKEVAEHIVIANQVSLGPLKGGSVSSVEVKYFTVSDVDLKSQCRVSTWYNYYILVNFTSKQKCEFHSGH